MNDSEKKSVTDPEKPVKEEAAIVGKKVKKHWIHPTWLRIVLKTLMWIIIAVLLIPVLLYVPPVQTLVKNVACNVVRKSTGMDIKIDRFRLKWPLDLSLQGVSIVEATGDTMVYAKEVIADVKLMPLLKLDAQINKLRLLDGAYRMVSPDSSMILKIKAGLLEVDDKSSANISNMDILLNKAYLKDGNLSLFMDVWKKQQSSDSTSMPLLIRANDLQLDNFTFSMGMLPTIDTLTLKTQSLKLRHGVIDLGKNSVTANYLGASDGEAIYLTPTPEYLETHPAPPADTTAVASPPMIIKGDTVELDRFKALYAVKDAKPLPGFDPSYIQVSDVNITLNDFYNAASTVELPITRITAKERSGLAITEGSGTIGVDSTGLSLRSVELKTLYSNISATAGVPFALMQLNPSATLQAKLTGSVGFPDIEAFMPTLKPYTSRLPKRSPLNFSVVADGTLADVDIPTFDVAVPGAFSLNARGRAANALDYKKLRGNLTFNGALTDPAIVSAFAGDMGFKIPTLAIKGTATADCQSYGADFSLLTSAGDVAANGKVNLNSEHYQADVSLRNVNVAYFAPTVGVGRVSGHISANGAGFNPTLAHAATDIKVDINSLVYEKKTLHDIVADVTLHDGAFTVNALSQNPGAKLRLDGSGTVAPDYYTFDLVSRIDELDLNSLGLTPDANHGKAEIFLKGSASPDKWLYDADVRVENLEWTAGNQYFAVPGMMTVNFKSTLDNVSASFDALMTDIRFNSESGLKTLIDSFTTASDSVMKQVDRRDLNVEMLQHALPRFTLDLNASGRGLVGSYLNTMGMSMDTIYGKIANDSLLRINIGAVEISNTSMRADTLSLNMLQRGSLLDYQIHMGNRANNPIAEFADVNLNGYLGSNRLLLSLSQKNQKGETGYRLGMTSAFTDSLISVHFTPLKATIAYLPWKFNTDNHIEYNMLNRHISADLQAESNESSILLKTQVGKNGNDEVHLALNNIKVQDFLRMSVFAPPLTASVNADLNVGYTNQWFYGNGTIGVNGFTYDKIRVGDFDLGLRAGYNNDGSTGALASLKIDGADALVAKMMLRPDSTGVITPRKLGIELTNFPLKVANAFLGKDVASLSGHLNGAIDMKGNFNKPLFFGSIACDSVGVYIPMMASSLKLNNDSIIVNDNVVMFNNFDIYGQNNNPLVIDGQVDASNLSNILFNLRANASNFQLIGNTKKSKGDIYGKVFLNLNAGVTGPMAHMNINANLDVLSTTDVTYSVPQTTVELTQQDASGVVKFVNLNDTTQVAKADSVTSPLAMRIVAGLTIQPGTQVEVDIPGTATTGNGKVEISPSGTLNYFQNYMGDMRLNGQINIGNGYAKYSVPVVGEKKFTFDPESYVHWNGDIMNPRLSISATDQIKTNLIESGNSKLVDFLVSLNVQNTLSAPKVLFDLSTDDDMSIQNDLLSMSPDQRSMAAINLLLTGQYSSAGVKTASSDMLQGALYGMLTSQLNSWMANHVKGVDLSFGVNQYDKTVNGETGSTTSYSYQMSKSLFNNRFKISVGGNYSTDASADENFSENLISDISFEYILKQTNNLTMYARLFRHTGYESILEGEITETGVGFVMKRRLATLRRLFRFPGRRKKKEAQQDSLPPVQPAFPAPLPTSTIDTLPSKPAR
ncbi:MAG: translocation/assembly module TamB domain-containing protein [Muribaculaceae bacterium]|nr:translocation/assembly module TamB domain-containing protein [Muribaculaceae bacterium]